ncbi:hypothetical protein [Caulobacter sp.]|uniref:hypothetical protein n=1 Tax=Caulobacter sp. TaxID=78 RepID=UPI002B47C54C|nr:hypothetical protein [Caulobacter sp.]HJV42626.1 hypothetical protein [Caulobacter sp.]
MTELTGPEDDRVEDEDLAEFRQALALVHEDHRRVLAILVPRLAALEERGDTEGAIALIARIREILAAPEAPAQ